MKKIALSKQNSNPNFIGSWMINPLSICDELIHYFDNHYGKQKAGVIGEGKDITIKDSIDLTVTPREIERADNPVFKQYMNNLFSCYRDYTQDWPFLTEFASELHIGEFNIQKYNRGQHFQKLHTERMGLSTLHRMFAWMTYLNDVEVSDGGATVFSHYDLEIQPLRGLTLIWPAEWTHAHRGKVLNAGSKYIITGWMHFPHTVR